MHARPVLLLLILTLLTPPVRAASPEVLIDLLQPIDPAARRGETADDFGAAKRILLSDLKRFLSAMKHRRNVLPAVGRVERSLSLVAELGGYNIPFGEETRSMKNFRELERFVARARTQATPKKPAPAKREHNVPAPPQPLGTLTLFLIQAFL